MHAGVSEREKTFRIEIKSMYSHFRQGISNMRLVESHMVRGNKSWNCKKS
jgi:hypothetical protein